MNLRAKNWSYIIVSWLCMLNWLFTGDPCAYQNRKTEAQRGRGRTSDSSGSAEEGARADVKGREEKRAGGKGEGGGRYVGFLRSTCPALAKARAN